MVVISSKVDYAAFALFSWKVSVSTFGEVEEHKVVMKRSLPVINQLLYLMLSVRSAWLVSRKFKPDIIHGNIAYPGAIWAYALSRLTGRPFVISDHTSRFRDNFRSILHRILTKFALKRAARVIAVSRWAARNVRDVIRREVDVIPNLIHVQDYAITQVAGAVPQIGFLGGLSTTTHRKGLDLLIQAIASIRKDFVLHIGGQGQLLPYYQEMARSHNVLDKCRFHGFIAHVPDFMEKLHFFVSASRAEAFGMVIVEAMACGLPVVATDSGGPSDFVDDTCGRLIPAGDVAALSEAIAWMIDHYQDFDRQRIRDRVLERYSPEAFVERMDRLYDAVTGRTA